MALVPLTVRRSKRKFDRSGKNFASEVQAYSDTRFISAVPSLCKKDGATDGIVNSLVKVDVNEGENYLQLWVTDTVAEIYALT